MKLQKKIKSTAYASITAALVTVMLIAGGFFEMLDLTCASVASLIIHISYTESGGKRALMIYGVSAILANIFAPLMSCPILFAAFFGYFPIVRAFLYKKIKIKELAYALLIVLYNAVMIALYNIFKTVFGLANEPMELYVALLVSANIFYICFELLMGRIMILYNHYIKRNFKNRGI